MPERYYLAERGSDGLRRIEVFEMADQDRALKAYAEMEEEIFQRQGTLVELDCVEDCCLFGSDSLATLLKTHASWFAPETLDLETMLHA